MSLITEHQDSGQGWGLLICIRKGRCGRLCFPKTGMPINIPFHMFLQVDIVLLPPVARFVIFSPWRWAGTWDTPDLWVRQKRSKTGSSKGYSFTWLALFLGTRTFGTQPSCSEEAQVTWRGHVEGVPASTPGNVSASTNVSLQTVREWAFRGVHPPAFESSSWGLRCGAEAVLLSVLHCPNSWPMELRRIHDCYCLKPLSVSLFSNRYLIRTRTWVDTGPQSLDVGPEHRGQDELWPACQACLHSFYSLFRILIAA